ncbi:TetR/AcrR family transcriptional regulator [Alcanivorax sp. EA2]|jgi:TetR/AcrR family transcriptional regulator, transcriptional repressor of aconitase|uniref:TetR/AcrR family transcriptional regulator n=1 Tax=Alloalcanivorax xenomutans TaxID=1094342 RepID=UPI000E39930A
MKHPKPRRSAPVVQNGTLSSDMTGGHRGRPIGDHDAKRAELMAAAIAVTAQEGYAGASMRKVAKHAGCTTGTVTYYFANKEEMDMAVAHRIFDRFDDLLASSHESADIKILIEQWFDWARLDEGDLWLALFQLLAHARHENAFAAIVQRRYKQFRQTLTSKLEKGQAHGFVRNDIPADLLADQLSAISDGWMMVLPTDRDRFKSDQARPLIEGVVRLISPAATDQTGNR